MEVKQMDAIESALQELKDNLKSADRLPDTRRDWSELAGRLHSASVQAQSLEKFCFSWATGV